MILGNQVYDAPYLGEICIVSGIAEAGDPSHLVPRLSTGIYVDFSGSGLGSLSEIWGR